MRGIYSIGAASEVSGACVGLASEGWEGGWEGGGVLCQRGGGEEGLLCQRGEGDCDRRKNMFFLFYIFFNLLL